MQKFLLKLSFVILLIVFADIIFGSIVDALYQFVPTKQSYALNKCTEDIVILGSSRAESGIIPSIITDSTYMSCYNLSKGGLNIYYYYGMLNTILTHHTPKILILDMTTIDYNDTPNWNTEIISVLNPLYNHVDSVKRLINSVDALNKWRLLSFAYQFNSTLFTLLTINIIEINHKNDFINGYIPSNKKHNNVISHPEINLFKIDDNKIEYINKIGNICLKRNIKLVLLLSPQFLNLEGKDQNISEFQNLMISKKYTLWNFSQDTSLLNHSDLFSDPAHMNNFGAIKYSQKVAQRLKEEVLNH